MARRADVGENPEGEAAFAHGLQPHPRRAAADVADDDGDLLIDYPDDPGCLNAGDDNEEDCIILEDVWCQGTFRALCRRKIYTYWREAGLRRVDTGEPGHSSDLVL